MQTKTGSTTDLERRLAQHQAGEGANHTKKRLPVKLVYYEESHRIDEALPVVSTPLNHRKKRTPLNHRKKGIQINHQKPPAV